MQVYLNGKKMKFIDGGYEYVFLKPYQRHTQEEIPRPGGSYLYNCMIMVYKFVP